MVNSTGNSGSLGSAAVDEAVLAISYLCCTADLTSASPTQSWWIVMLHEPAYTAQSEQLPLGLSNLLKVIITLGFLCGQQVTELKADEYARGCLWSFKCRHFKSFHVS